jgi:predicted nucleotidyltransferase
MTIPGSAQAHVAFPVGSIDSFCRRWSVRELSLFGSVLREDFSPESDVDVLVAFEPGAQRSLFDFVEMRDELMELFGREVDLVSQGGLRNPFRRHEILTTRQVLTFPESQRVSPPRNASLGRPKSLSATEMTCWTVERAFAMQGGPIVRGGSLWRKELTFRTAENVNS